MPAHIAGFGHELGHLKQTPRCGLAIGWPSGLGNGSGTFVRVAARLHIAGREGADADHAQRRRSVRIRVPRDRIGDSQCPARTRCLLEVSEFVAETRDVCGIIVC